MKVLVTGVTGQLGHDVAQELERRNIDVYKADSKEMPLTDKEKMRSVMERVRPDAVIHCAAYTAVDLAESEQEKCLAINFTGTQELAKLCKMLDAKMIYISTDYVFPGTGTNFYEVDDEKAPLNIYGRSKLLGEQAVTAVLDKYFIVRISWVFGINGKNFVKTMLRLAKDHKELTVVDDQVGSPTYTRDLAELLSDMVVTDKYGVYHATNEGICSWAEFAAEIFRQAGTDVKVTPVPSSAYKTAAARPKNSRLSKNSLDAAGFKRLPTWQDAIGRYLIELG